MRFFGVPLISFECSHASKCDLNHLTADLAGSEKFAFGRKFPLTSIHEFTVPPNMVKVKDIFAHPGISSGKHCDVSIEMYGEGTGW